VTLGGWPAKAVDEGVLRTWIENSITVLVRVRIEGGRVIAEVRPPAAEDEATLILARPTTH
jgi:hypothetical protein